MEWYPDSVAHKRYGALALILGTVSVTGLAMLMAVPLGLGAAIYVSEYSTGKRKEILKVVVELLAAVYLNEYAGDNWLTRIINPKDERTARYIAGRYG